MMFRGKQIYFFLNANTPLKAFNKGNVRKKTGEIFMTVLNESLDLEQS